MNVPVPAFWPGKDKEGSQMPVSAYEQAIIAELRAAGCQDMYPLIGYWRDNPGEDWQPRCRLCNVRVSISDRGSSHQHRRGPGNLR